MNVTTGDLTLRRIFDNYPHSLGALDATLTEIRKPLEYNESGEYLSGKHMGRFEGTSYF